MPKSKAFLIALICAVSAIGLFAGIALRNALEPEPTLDDLRQYAPHWQPLMGRQGTVDDWSGKKLVLNFWGSWCPPCIAEMPLLDRFNSEFGEQLFQVVGIAIDDAAAAENFLRSNDIAFLSFVVGPGSADALMDLFGNDSSVLPFSVVFSPDGSVDQLKIGEFSESELAAIVSQ